jgi:hypothetical protein
VWNTCNGGDGDGVARNGSDANGDGVAHTTAMAMMMMMAQQWWQQ